MFINYYKYDWINKIIIYEFRIGFEENKVYNIILLSIFVQFEYSVVGRNKLVWLSL